LGDHAHRHRRGLRPARPAAHVDRQPRLHGHYEVVDGAQRRLVGDDGFFEIRLAADGTGSVFAIDT
jgi:hypothetical protein